MDRKKGTGQPDRTKDRSRHEAARGSKKLKLADLTRELPDQVELRNLSETLLVESDRGAALMASAFLEETLCLMITCSLPDWGKATTLSWFEGPNAPFLSLSAKIALGQALGIYGPKTADLLNVIRSIRNCFAHRMKPLDFKHPTIVEECCKLAQNDFLPDATEPARTRFCAVCLNLGESFVKDSFENGGKEITTRFG